MTDLRLAVITASVRQGRFGPVVSRWFSDVARAHGQFDVDDIDLAGVPLPLELPPGRDAWERPEGLAPVTARLDRADAFVVVTPEYNHSFPASIKSLIDWHLEEWQAKPVGFVSYGGLAGGARAVEQLRPVFAEVHAVTVRDMLTFDRYWERFGEDGRPLDAEADGAAKVMLDQLGWWASALRAARPYVSA